MNITCPNCHSEIAFDDAFTNFDDWGDYIRAHAIHTCPECDYTMTIQTTFEWNEEVEVY